MTEPFIIGLIVAGAVCVAGGAVYFFRRIGGRNRVIWRIGTRDLKHKLHELFCMASGYIGFVSGGFDDFSATFHILIYHKWKNKSEKYKVAHPYHSVSAFPSLIEKCEEDLPLAFCISSIEYYVAYGDALSGFLGFYVDRCGVRSAFGSYCARFYNEWTKFWKENERRFGEVKLLVGRDLWENGFVFGDIPEQIKATAEKTLAEYRAIKAKYMI